MDIHLNADNYILQKQDDIFPNNIKIKTKNSKELMNLCENVFSYLKLRFSFSLLTCNYSINYNNGEIIIHLSYDKFKVYILEFYNLNLPIFTFNNTVNMLKNYIDIISNYKALLFDIMNKYKNVNLLKQEIFSNNNFTSYLPYNFSKFLKFNNTCLNGRYIYTTFFKKKLIYISVKQDNTDYSSIRKYLNHLKENISIDEKKLIIETIIDKRINACFNSLTIGF